MFRTAPVNLGGLRVSHRIDGFDSIEKAIIDCRFRAIQCNRPRLAWFSVVVFRRVPVHADKGSTFAPLL